MNYSIRGYPANEAGYTADETGYPAGCRTGQIFVCNLVYSVHLIDIRFIIF